LCDENVEEERVQGGSSVEEEKGGETKKERDAHLDHEEREKRAAVMRT